MPISIYYDVLYGSLPVQFLCKFKFDTDQLVCALSGEILTEPVIASDGYTYQRAQIVAWCEQNSINGEVWSPKTDEILLCNDHQQIMLYPNMLLQELQHAPSNLNLQAINDAMHLAWPRFVSMHKPRYFENKLIYQLVNNFLDEYSKIYEIDDYAVRTLLHLIITNQYQQAKLHLWSNRQLAFRPLTSSGEYLLHLCVHLNKLSIVSFIVEELGVPLEQVTSQGFYAIFYINQQSGFDIINYWHSLGLSLNFFDHTHQVDLLLYALSQQRLDLIEHIFNLGFVISSEPKYLQLLQKKLAPSSYSIMRRVVIELQKNPAIISSLTFVHALAVNVLLTPEQFTEMFIIFGDYLQYAALVKANPYCLGVIAHNRRYVHELHRYWCAQGLAPIINLPAEGHLETPLIFALQPGYLDLASLLLALGAEVNITYKSANSYPLLVALSTDNLPLIGLLRRYNATLTNALIIQVLPALFQSKSLTIADFVSFLQEIDHHSFNALITGNEFLLTEALILHDNFNLLLAFEKIFELHSKFFNIFTVDLMIARSNPLHAAVVHNQAQFAEYLAKKYPSLLLQANSSGDTPFELALKSATWSIICDLLDVLTMYDLQALKEMLAKIDVTKFLESNNNLNSQMRLDMLEILKNTQPYSIRVTI